MPKQIEDLPVEAGVYTEQTGRGAAPRYKRADKVRWRKGLPEKIGGWVRVAAGQLVGLARQIWDWSSLDATVWSGIGTESKLYLYNRNGLFDITPVRRTAFLTNPFTTTISSPIVTVTDVAHGAQVGDFVRFSGATIVNNLFIDGEYQIVSVTDTDNFTIDAGSNANASGTGGGTVEARYDIPVGQTSTGFGSGWGTGTWSQETWSTPRTITQFVERLRTWSLDNWGEDLIANPRGGGVYWWDRSTGESTRAVILEGAPPRSNFIIISQRDRHLFALGCTDFFTGQFDPLLIRWCSKEDFNDWVPTSVNTAGDLRLFRGSEILGAVRTRGEILVFTDVSVHQINFLGGTAVFGTSVVGENVSLLGPNAAVEVDYRVFFMAEADFYIYDGVLRPLPCDVRNFVYGNLTQFQKDKVFAGLNREFNEIWWFYPAKDETTFFESTFVDAQALISYESQTGGAGVYDVQRFAAGGYIALSDSPASSNYDAVFLTTDSQSAAVTSPDDADYELLFVANGLSYPYGVVFEVTDLSGTALQSDDNIDCLFVTVDGGTNTLRFGKNVAGVAATLDNAAASYSLAALATSVTLTAGRRYSIIASRVSDAISAYLYDEASDTLQLVATVALSAGELINFPGTVKRSGVMFQQQQTASAVDQMRAESYRVGEGGTLITATQRGATTEINRYCLFNYEEGHWSIGALTRTAWADRSPQFNKPYAGGEGGQLFVHETGDDDDGLAMEAFAETYDFEIPSAGEYLMHVDQLIPDFLELDGQVDIRLQAKKYPQDAVTQEKGPFPVTTGVNKISTRVRGRQIALRMESTRIGDRWRLGTMRARLMPHGKRA